MTVKEITECQGVPPVPETFPTCQIHGPFAEINEKLVLLDTIGHEAEDDSHEDTTDVVEENRHPLAKLVMAFIEFIMWL